MFLGSIHPNLGDPTGIPHGHIGPQPTTDLLVGTGHLLLQSRQRQHHASRDGRASTCGGFGEALGERAVNGHDQSRPRKRIRPLADGMRFGDEICHLEARSTSGQPMLEVSSELHRRLS